MLPFFDVSGAGNETRTRDLNLGKVALYQLSYSRVEAVSIAEILAASDTGLKRALTRRLR
ncbi:MAG: CDP-diacylglycerol-glycerol-3-phosphate 3-phosphatidyltransferase [Ramlibacter sp.]|nr:CDP-diacylglycerol-glycerol-3-phosphate 3-phosphatidyltransferase [Ramlibacter sp.]